MDFLSNGEKEKWIQDHVERETAGARKQVEDTDTVVQQGQEDTRKAENDRLTNRESEKTFQEMKVAIVDCLSDLGSSDDGEDGEDEDDEETKQGQLSEDDEPGWVMGTISTTVQLRVGMFREKRMKLYELTQPGWEDATDYFHDNDIKCGTCELKVPAVV